MGRLIDRMVRPVGAADPLIAVLEATARAAHEAGLADQDIEAELVAYNAGRLSPHPDIGERAEPGRDVRPANPRKAAA